jgi:hypothetical protein
MYLISRSYQRTLAGCTMESIHFCRTTADIYADLLYDPNWVAKSDTQSSQTQYSSINKLFIQRLQAAEFHGASHIVSIEEKGPFKPYSVFSLDHQPEKPEKPIQTISPQLIA